VKGGLVRVGDLVELFLNGDDHRLLVDGVLRAESLIQRKHRARGFVEERRVAVQLVDDGAARLAISLAVLEPAREEDLQGNDVGSEVLDRDHLAHAILGPLGIEMRKTSVDQFVVGNGKGSTVEVIDHVDRGRHLAALVKDEAGWTVIRALDFFRLNFEPVAEFVV